MEQFFKEKSKKIRLFIATETETDPFEHTVSKSYLPHKTINAIVTDLDMSKVQWAMPGIVTEKAKQIIIRKKYESLLKATEKIKINNEYYNGWRVNGRLQYKIEGNYIRAYVYNKKVS